MSSNAILTAIKAITEMYEETLVTFWGSLNLTSYMFNTEERLVAGTVTVKGLLTVSISIVPLVFLVMHLSYSKNVLKLTTRIEVSNI